MLTNKFHNHIFSNQSGDTDEDSAKTYVNDFIQNLSRWLEN